MVQKISQRKFVKAVGTIGSYCVRRDENGSAWRTPDGAICTEFVVNPKDIIYWRIG